MKIRLLRTESSDQGTFGHFEGLPEKLFTGEEPWRDNKANESCIPPGLYKCVWSQSTRLSILHGQPWFTYEVLNVPGRSGIRIHSANWVGDKTKGYKKELSGCIAPGLNIGQLEGQKAILQSRDALAYFQGQLNKAPFDLEIVRL